MQPDQAYACASGAGCTPTERYHEGPCAPAGPHVYNEIDDSLNTLQSWIDGDGRACYAEYPKRVRAGVQELRSTIATLIAEKEARPALTSRFEQEIIHAHQLLDGLLDNAEECWWDTIAWRALESYVFDNICGPARERQAEHQDQVKVNDQ
jgi:hypothetical protein